ncbi:hypothetical protein HU200_063041 [Digitaria exilis]|uniref:PHD-type domain-containing protein n=1 Tax=Digitaria exilis TaxID=1010633 RepID=A0A835E019_9POAL|nr:hypothetical protein HU200_063041 [Digitaria exilis]
MTIKSSRCSDEIHKEPLLYRKKEFRSSVIKIVDSSNSSLWSADSICSIPVSEDGSYLNKRRKMDEEYDPLVTIGNIKECTTKNFTTTGYIPSPEDNLAGKSHMLLSSVEIPGSHSNTNNGPPPSASHVPPDVNQSIKDAWECSLPDTSAAKPVTEATSARDLCFSILKGQIFPARGSELCRTSNTIEHDDNQNSPLFECMTCGSMEDPSKMLICDCCEGAFHLLCCTPCVKKIPDEEWYCLVCKRKKSERQRGQFRTPKGKLPKYSQRPQRGLGPIQDMLVDAESYESEVRIGSKFQADIPEWSGPILSNRDQFTEPTELDPSETTVMGPCYHIALICEYIFFPHGRFVGHHCLLFNQVIGTVRVQLSGIPSMLIVLFHRYNPVILSFGCIFCVTLWEGACFSYVSC